MGREWQVMGGLAVAMAIGVGSAWVGQRGETGVARAFMPGALGSEPGAAAPGPSTRAYLTRAMYAVASEGGEEWSRHNGLTEGLNFSHNLRWIFPPNLFAAHPEFFPLEDGQRLKPPEGTYFWQPDLGREDVAKYAAEAARRFFDENPQAESFSLGENDGMRFGESTETLKLVTPLHWFRERPDYSPVVFTFMNRAADELARTHPNKLLGALAYYWCENAPPFPVRRQVVPYLTADRAQGYDAAFWREEALLQRRWVSAKRSDRGQRVASDAAGRRTDGGGEQAEGGGRKPEGKKLKPETGNLELGAAVRLGIYDYLYGDGFLIPRIHTRLLAENLRRARRAGFTDYFAETHFNWGLDGPMPWLAAQLLLDPEQSPEARLEEYYRRFFRGAAVPMRRFFERCERQWMTQAGGPYWLKRFRDESQADIFPAEVCRDLRGLLDGATRWAGDPVATQRVNFVSDAFGVTERFVGMQEARETLNRRVLRRAGSWRALARAMRDFEDRRGEFESYTRALQAREPLAVPEFDWSDYLRHDPVPGALREIARQAGAAQELAAAEAEVGSDGVARAIMETASRDGTELLHEGSLEGTLRPAKTVAGLNFEVALPPAWLSWAEPCEHFSAERVDGARPVLRLRWNKETQIYQWCGAPAGRLAVARVAVRGRVSPSGAASLVLSWMDKDNQRLGAKIVRLPEGDWPKWVELELAGAPPDGAVWVGIGLRVQNQSAGDWIEAREFSLQAMP